MLHYIHICDLEICNVVVELETDYEMLIYKTIAVSTLIYAFYN